MDMLSCLRWLFRSEQRSAMSHLAKPAPAGKLVICCDAEFHELHSLGQAGAGRFCTLCQFTHSNDRKYRGKGKDHCQRKCAIPACKTHFPSCDIHNRSSDG